MSRKRKPTPNLRPVHATATNLDDWVREGPDNLKHLETPGNVSGRSETSGKSLVKRRSGKVRRRRTVYLPPTLDAQLAEHCELEGREVSAFVARAIEAQLGTGA